MGLGLWRVHVYGIHLSVCVRVVHVGSFHVYVPCVYLSVYMECGGCVCMQRSQNRGVAGISVP